MKRGARHLGDVLAADREIDHDAAFDFTAGLIGEPEERVRYPPLYLLGRDLDYTGMRLLKARTDC